RPSPGLLWPVYAGESLASARPLGQAPNYGVHLMSRERICAVALGEVGVTEAANRDRIEQYMASVTDSRWKIELFDSDGNPRKLRWGDAWCACFASWVYKE